MNSPRDPLDIRLDRLNQHAQDILARHQGLHLTVLYASRWVDTPAFSTPVQQLLDHGFFTLKSHNQTEATLAITADGNNAQLRLNSGIYAHRKKRDEQQQISTESTQSIIEEFAAW